MDKEEFRAELEKLVDLGADYENARYYSQDAEAEKADEESLKIINKLISEFYSNVQEDDFL